MKIPIDYKYDEHARSLDIEYGDGSVVRYFDIQPELAFLDPLNLRRNRDFINFLESNLVKTETIQEPTNPMDDEDEPQTRPGLVQQQSQKPQTRLTFISPWSSPKPVGNDGDA